MWLCLLQRACDVRVAAASAGRLRALSTEVLAPTHREAAGAQPEICKASFASGVDRKTPLAYFQDLRIEREVHFLKTSTTTVDEIASQIGYANGVTLRSLLRRRLGRGVREIRGGA